MKQKIITLFKNSEFSVALFFLFEKEPFLIITLYPEFDKFLSVIF